MVVIVRYAEIGLKGQNRPFFEKKLVSNIKDCLNRNNILFREVKRKTGRILIDTKEECKALSKVFGISSFSEAIEMEYNIDEICKKALSFYKKGTFRISANCISKCDLSSQEINQVVGQYIVDKTNAKVSLKNPDINIEIEIINSNAYFFTSREKGPGGLPVGTQGLVAVLLEDEKSIDAAIMMLKRGCSIVFIKTKSQISLERIKDYITRIRVLDDIPDNATAIVLSETITNMTKRDFNRPILRPLIGKWQE